MTMPGQRHASDHDAHAFITAHRVYCDSRPCPHFRQLLVRTAASLRSDSNDFSTVIMAAGTAQIVGTLQFAAVRAFLKSFDTKRIMRSEEHTSELQSLMRISYAVFCLKKKKTKHRKSTP